MFSKIGPWEIILILVIVMIIFGAGKLPQVGSALGKGIRSFKEGASGAEDKEEEEDDDDEYEYYEDDGEEAEVPVKRTVKRATATRKTAARPATGRTATARTTARKRTAAARKTVKKA